MDESILCKLKGGDRRSIGRVEEVIAQVLDDTTLFDVLVFGMLDEDPLVRMRAADGVEKVTARHPEYLEPYRALLIERVSKVEQQEVRWHVAQILPRLKWNAEDQEPVLRILLSYLNDNSRIVRTFTMQALADLTKQDAALVPRVVHLLQELVGTGSPAMQSRGRRLLRELGAQE